MKKILVVEDNPSNAELLDDMLGAGGYEVISVGRGDQALEELKKSQPDLVLMDIQLPDTSGYEVVEKMRSEPPTSGIPVIAVTGYDEECQREAALEAGFDEYINKPVNRKELLRMVERYAGKVE